MGVLTLSGCLEDEGGLENGGDEFSEALEELKLEEVERSTLRGICLDCIDPPIIWPSGDDATPERIDEIMRELRRRNTKKSQAFTRMETYLDLHSEAIAEEESPLEEEQRAPVGPQEGR